MSFWHDKFTVIESVATDCYHDTTFGMMSALSYPPEIASDLQIRLVASYF